MIGRKENQCMTELYKLKRKTSKIKMAVQNHGKPDK